MAETTAHARRDSIVDLTSLAPGKARAEAWPATQSFFGEVDRADIAMAVRTVDLYLEAELGDFVEGSEGKPTIDRYINFEFDSAKLDNEGNCY